MKHSLTNIGGAFLWSLVVLAGTASNALGQSNGNGNSGSGPRKPTGLTVDLAPSGGAVVHWNDRSTDEIGFEVVREAYVATTWQGTAVLSASANTTALPDAVDPGVYRYRIRALGTASNSAYTSWYVKTIPAPTGGGGPTVPPSAPSGLAASDIGGGRAMVSWTDTSGTETGFRVERNPAFGAPVSVSSNTTAYVDTCNNGTFAYRVVAFNVAGDSAYSAWATATVTSGTTGGTGGGTGGSQLPSAPTGLTVSDAGAGRALVSWTDTSSNESGFTVERDPPFASAVSLAANTASYDDGCNNGTFNYRVVAYNAAGSSAYTPWTSGTITSGTTGGGSGGGGGAGGSISPGWTTFTPSADSRIVYVSASAGSDSNNGLSEATPKRTLAAGYAALRDGMPDWLLLKSGDTWREVFTGWQKSGRSTAEPMRIGSFGGGERPVLLCGNQTGFYSGAWVNTLAHVALTDIRFVADGYDGSTTTPRGIEIHGNWNDMLVENCSFERFFVNVVFDSDPVTQNLTNIRLRRSTAVDAFRVSGEHAEGAYFGGVSGLLIEECAFDHNGWSETIPGAVPNIFRHNVYIQTNCSNVTTRNIISARAAATGMQQRGGGLCEGHLFLKNPLNIVFGTGGIVRDCVVLDSRDIDAANPRGIGIQVSGGSNVELAGNICATRTTPGTWNIQAYSLDNAWSNVWLHDNIAWKWRAAGASGSAVEVWGTPTGWLKLTNNHFQMASGGDVVGNHTTVPVTYTGNKYYSTEGTSFQIVNTRMAFPQWQTATNDSGSNFGADSFPDPDRTIATYMASLGRTATLDAFMTEVRAQSKANWRTEFTAKAVGDYIRAGFGVTTQTQ